MFIPVAVNLYEIRKDTGPAGTLFKSVQRQLDQYQGFWIISPEGKALAKYHDWQGDPAVPESKRVPMTLDAGLKAFGPVTPRDVTDRPASYRGKGVRPDGKVNLALYGRLMHLERRTADDAGQRDPPGAGGPPSRRPRRKGPEWTLPVRSRNLARSLLSRRFRRHLPRGLAQAGSGEGGSIEDGKARIRLTGTWKAEGLYGRRRAKGVRRIGHGDGIALYGLEEVCAPS